MLCDRLIHSTFAATVRSVIVKSCMPGPSPKRSTRDFSWKRKIIFNTQKTAIFSHLPRHNRIYLHRTSLWLISLWQSLCCHDRNAFEDQTTLPVGNDKPSLHLLTIIELKLMNQREIQLFRSSKIEQISTCWSAGDGL